jgi:hypothetical protein
METSLTILWYAFSIAWIGYLVFLVAASGQQKRIWQLIRGVRERLEEAGRN